MQKWKFLKFLVLFLVVCLFLYQWKQNDQVEAAYAKTGSVDLKSGALNVRCGPGKQFKVIGWLKSGQMVTVYSQTKSGWSEIHYNREKAYVSTLYLRIYSPMSINNAKNITDKVISLQRKTWDSTYTEKQIYSIMTSGFTPNYIQKYFSQQFRLNGKDKFGNQLYHIKETEIWGYAIDEFDWKPASDPKVPTVTYFIKDGKEYLVVSQYHLNEESGNHTSTLYLVRNNVKANWNVYDYVVKF
ncbi:MAG: SH3 domain-containing protein [Bacillota bacterium]|nr:SH3 domain-containing protein [Bacillota bacterium]